ncbi:ABC transporter permease [Xylanimonas allomyrinae]|uniref:ABC transporter permease n=1 Tax=Xylanimonas allomyrinae TaxID=2509459 RepID=A0A4P6ERH4_9MICO|nr:ABC transporter permease [Xylanimonas allomyrinae]QAY64513.1 ABC transporter permease [Xylanimonas allomyrinae]
MSPRDLWAEALHGIGTRPTRLFLTVLGTVLGIGAVVVTVGLAQTAAGQITKQFDAVAATQVVVKPDKGRFKGEERDLAALPWDGEDRVRQVAGVVAAGSVTTVDIGQAAVTTAPVNDPSSAAQAAPKVMAASAGLLDAVRGQVVTGRFFDAGHDARADRVVVLGAGAAQRLGVHRVDRQPAVFIGDVAYTVIGIIDGMHRVPALKDAVILPASTARQELGAGSPDELQIRIATGAGAVVAHQAPIALDPNNPEAYKVQAPTTGSSVQANVQADVNALFLALGGVALVVGGLGIANVTLLSVLERVAEIGLRRALGASRRAIAGQFVIESATTGLLGGLMGTALAVLVVVGVSAARDWTPILDLRVAFGSALLGAVVGLVAGAYPAIKAASIEPVTALRGGV